MNLPPQFQNQFMMSPLNQMPSFYGHPQIADQSMANHSTMNQTMANYNSVPGISQTQISTDAQNFHSHQPETNEPRVVEIPPQKQTPPQ